MLDSKILSGMAPALRIFVLKERIRRFKAVRQKIDDDMYSLVYLNQNPKCLLADKEAVFCIDILTKFPVVIPLDLLPASLNGMLILDYESIKQYLMPNNDLRKTKKLLQEIISQHEKLVLEFEEKNPGILDILEGGLPKDFTYPDTV